LVDALAHADVSVWFDQLSLLPGQKWEDVIEDEIAASRVFLTCLSSAAMERPGYFHAEARQASEVALRIPPDKLFVIPVALGSVDLPRAYRQYHVVDLLQPGALSGMFQSLSIALDRTVTASDAALESLREALLDHLGVEGESNESFAKQFADPGASPESSARLIERIANSADSNRLTTLLQMRAIPNISFAEEAALDMAIDSVRHHRRNEGVGQIVRQREWEKIQRMEIPGNEEATRLMRTAKMTRFLTRKGTPQYEALVQAINDLLFGSGS